MMDQELKTKWLTALRGGEYQQTRGYLCKGKGFCCLGVLLDVQGFDIMGEYPDDSDRETAFLPGAYNGGVDSGTANELASMNDGRGLESSPNYKPPMSFAEIADWIEANL